MATMHLLLSAMVLLLPRQAMSQGVKSCGGPKDHLKNPVIKVSPDPPKRGANVYVEISGDLDEVEGDFNINMDLQIHTMGLIKSTMKGSVPFSMAPAIKGPFALTVGPMLIPGSGPGGAMKGRIHVENGKKEQIMCVDVNLDVPHLAVESNTSALGSGLEAPPKVGNCGKSNDHIHGFSLTTSGGKTTVTGNLDETVTKGSVMADMQLKSFFMSFPLKARVPFSFKEGDMASGAIKFTNGPNHISITPELPGHIEGKVMLDDAKGQELMCLDVTLLSKESESITLV